MSNIIANVYVEFERMAMECGYYVKFLGDGLMMVREMGGGHNCGVTMKFLQDAESLTHRIEEIIRVHWPRPDGFRIRVTSGHVWKRMATIRSGGRRQTIRLPEYIGYSVNLAQRLLEVQPTIACICDESIPEILGPKKQKLSLERMGTPKERPRGVDPEDLERLWIFRCEKDANVGADKKALS